jgi:hypothetical protein
LLLLLLFAPLSPSLLGPKSDLMGLKPEEAEECWDDWEDEEECCEEECWEECWEGEKRLAQLSSRLSSSRNSSESRLAFMPLLCCAVH